MRCVFPEKAWSMTAVTEAACAFRGPRPNGITIAVWLLRAEFTPHPVDISMNRY